MLLEHIFCRAKIAFAIDSFSRFSRILEIIDECACINTITKILLSYSLKYLAPLNQSVAFFFASLNPFLFSRTQVLHCRSAHTQSRAGMKQFTRSLSISLWKLLLRAERRAETRSMSSHKRLLPLSKLSPKAAYVCGKSASLVKR